jgi:Flp pilus assembly pilin Flp
MSAVVRVFLRDEDGAVTVDWVLLTAIIVGMAIGVVSIISTAAQDPAKGLGAWLTEIDVAT